MHLYVRSKQRLFYTATFLFALIFFYYSDVYTNKESEGGDSKQLHETKFKELNTINISFGDLRSPEYPENRQIETGLRRNEKKNENIILKRSLGKGIKLNQPSIKTSSPARGHLPKVVNLTHVTVGTPKHIRCSCDPLHVDPASKVSQALSLTASDPFGGMSTGESLSRHHPNLLLTLLNDTTPRCSLMPNVFDIAWKGVHWQGYGDSLSDIGLLYSAFYDNRPSKDSSGGSIRILAMLMRSDGKLPSCHLWYAGQKHPVVSQVLQKDYLDWQKIKNDTLKPYSLTCAVLYMDEEEKKKAAVPTAVSLVSEPCERATNVLKVLGKPVKEVLHLKEVQQPSEQLPASDPQWRVAVCGPALFYVQEDFSIRIVEWFELLKTLGVSQVFLYQTQGLHPNISKVLQYYEHKGFVELIDFHYPPPFMDDPLLRRTWNTVQEKFMFAMENIYFTDCVLRYKDRYRFLAHFDPDEVPVLLQHNSLPELVANLTNRFSKQNKQPPGYKLHWAFFPLFPSTQGSSEPHGVQPSDDGVIKHLTILRNTKRLAVDKIKQHNNFKTIYDTRYVTGVYSHSTFYCTWGPCNKSTAYMVPENIAVTGHFRNACDSKCKEHNYTIEVPEVAKHREEVLPKIELVLRQLVLIPP